MPTGVWIGLGLLVVAPLVAVLFATLAVEPAGDAGFMAFEEDETGFFPFLGFLFAVLSVLIAAVVIGVFVGVIALVLILISAVGRR